MGKLFLNDDLNNPEDRLSDSEKKIIFKIILTLGLLCLIIPFALFWLMSKYEIRMWIINNLDSRAGSGPYALWHSLFLFVLGLVLILISIINLGKK